MGTSVVHRSEFAQLGHFGCRRQAVTSAPRRGLGGSNPSWATGELTDPQPSQSHKTRPEVRRRRQSSTPPAAMRSFRAHHDSAATTPEGATRCLVTLERRRRAHAQSGHAPVQPNGLSRRCQPACQTPKCRRNVVSASSAESPHTPGSGGRWPALDDRSI